MIEVHIQKRLGDFDLDVAFDAPAGVTAIFGSSGSGKTSLINAVAGLIDPDCGRIVVAGRTLFAPQVNVPVHKRNLGYVFQDSRLFPHLTVAQNLAFGGAFDSARIIDLLGLSPLLARSPKSLSGGEKSRVALGRALMSKPAMLLLDEPLAALDGPRKAEILPYLERLRDEMAVPMIYVSHDITEVTRLANTLVVIDRGRVVKAGPLGAVLADPVVAAQIGTRDAGAAVLARVVAPDTEDALTTLAFDGGSFVVSGRVGNLGQEMRIHISAQDVILSRDVPKAISARNVLPVRVVSLEGGDGAGVIVGLRAGEAQLLARITKASLRKMDISEGSNIYAIVKATAVAR